jgi:Transposase DNA-binding
MSHWVAAEMAECQMQDARHAKRLAQLLARLGEKPVSSMPSVCHGWAETVAAYRFLENPAIGLQEILSGHTHATLDRIPTPEVVVLVHDTTCIDAGTPHPKAGLGTVKGKSHEEYLWPPTVALTPERVT